MDVDGCPTCKLRSVQLSPQATPNKTRKFGKVGPKGDPVWERGIVTDRRGMPICKPDGNLIRNKEYAERRHEIEAGRRALANTPL